MTIDRYPAAAQLSTPLVRLAYAALSAEEEPRLLT
jgi:hypothetical protein